MFELKLKMRSMSNIIRGSVFAGAALLFMGTPHCAYADVFDLSWTGAYGPGSATLTATALGGGVFNVTALSGTQNGSSISLIAQASTGREAIEQFRRHRPDITLMDLQMPDISGIEAIIAIRSEFPEARIIVLTTYAGDVQVVRALKAGARGYLLKGHVRSSDETAISRGNDPAGIVPITV
jgi:CheY-like chemotaxis protein